MQYRRQPAWRLPERVVTPERWLLDRRQVLKAMAAAGCGVLGLPALGRASEALRNPRYTLDRPITAEAAVSTFNNFIEFSVVKSKVAKLVDKFVVDPWTVEVAGLVRKPLKLDVDELARRMPIEERVYRHRCVEGWSFAAPWTGFPLSKLLELAQPLPQARFVRFVSFNEPEQAPGIKRFKMPWPYNEALTLPEAMHELSFAVTGMYGHGLAKQNGAPLRLAIPWKFGYKSAKSIVRIELLDRQPVSFWQSVMPDEYEFDANVDPTKRHPRYSMATERVLGTGELRPTLHFNGYGNFVAGLYI